MVAVNVVHLLTQPALPLRLGPAVEPPATSAMPAQTGLVNRTIVIRFQEGQGLGYWGLVWGHLALSLALSLAFTYYKLENYQALVALVNISNG